MRSSTQRVLVQADPTPLCVDLDGALLKSDMLVESLFAMLRRNVFLLFAVPFWLLGGRAHLKQRIADHAVIDPGLMPYHGPFLEFLRKEAREGRRLVLATASNRKFAALVAEHLGIFADVVASDGERNLSGRRKARALVERFGDRGFDYAANSLVDLAVWRHARLALLVNPERAVEASARRLGNVAQVFDDRQDGIAAYLRAMRPHQWLKNLLVFVPLLAAHVATDWRLVLDASLAFVAFSLCASSAYLFNDLLDLPVDRAHPNKRHRPFAAGTIQPMYGAVLVPTLLAAGLAVAAVLPMVFLAVLVAYYGITVAYSCYLKRLALIDVMTLAGLYTLRVIGGAAAISVMPSFWLLALSIFVFLSLALVKRSAELFVNRSLQAEGARGRGYRVTDLEYLHSMGTASGYMAVLVTALYINDEAVLQGYTHPYILWLVCPLFLYWISRVWLKTGRGEMHDDPLVFAIRDRQSQLIGLTILAVAWVASVF